jgi:septum formation protein
MLLLEEAGFNPIRIQCDLDDDLLRPSGSSALAACAARAWFKAVGADLVLRADWAAGSSPDGGVLLAADTLCEMDGRLLGKAQRPGEAEEMIRGLSGRSHRTITGVALLERVTMKRSIWCDTACVMIGELQEEQIQEYVASGAWRGKSGGYNLADRIEAGWPIECEGDPATVMGLPMLKLVPQLNDLLSEAGQ